MVIGEEGDDVGHLAEVGGKLNYGDTARLLEGKFVAGGI